MKELVQLNSDPIEMESRYSLLKKGIWLYFFLLIFEGALRKWVLPELATPLLIVRDPIAVFMLIKSMQYGLLKPNLYVLLSWIISFISFYATLLFGHGDVMVALYGVRILVLHFPLIFVIGKTFNRNDVIKVGQILLWIHIGMTLLVAIQFFSPQTAWVNRGVGGDMEGSGFGATEEFYRVPGTFSFTTGLSFFYGFVAAYIFYFWLDNRESISKGLLIISTLCLLAAIPLSVSRTVFFEVILSGVFTVLAAGRTPKVLFQVIGSLIVGICIFWVLSNMAFFQIATGVFSQRFTDANSSEGGVEGVLIDRFLGGMVGALTGDLNFGFFGKGLGMGTNAGAQLMTGKVSFLISEGEWGRLIGEMGLFLGFMVIVIRVLLTIRLSIVSWYLVKKFNYLPWLLCSFGIILLLQGPWGQPTTLGFSVFSGGLILAASREKDE
ncbi:MAG: hypothetical protein NVV82_03370 [Sporocytophaga sp.]|nr:hypothetical protein [Sporocytophaga sp.]